LVQHQDERPWTTSSTTGELEGAGALKKAIEESILTIWCLKMVQEEGAEDQDWQNHLLAWLVRDLLVLTLR
jgi:hypothetical protein